jgi:hypothetical protein
MKILFISMLMSLSASALAKQIVCPPPGKPVVKGLEVLCEYTTEKVTTHTANATCPRNFKLESYKGEAMCVKEKKRKTVIKDKAKCIRGTMDNVTGICTWTEKKIEKNLMDNAILQ